MKKIGLFLAAGQVLAAPALALQYPSAHFGSLTLDAPLAVTGGGLGNANGDASTLTVGPAGSTSIQTLAKALAAQSDVRFYGAGGAPVSQTCASDASAAIMSAANSGGAAFLPAGCYLVSSSVILNSGVRIKGAGRDLVTIKLAAGANVDVFQTANAYGLFGTPYSLGVNNWELSDLTIDGNGSAQTATGSAIDAVNGIALYGGGWRLQHVTIKNVLGHGIRSEWQQYGEIAGGLEARLYDVTIDGAGRHGWWFGGPHDLEADGLVVIDACNSADNTWSAVYQDPALHGNGRFNAYHSWHRSAATNRCAWGYSSSGASQFVNAHFEGARGWFQHNGSSDTIVGSLFYAAQGYANTAMIQFNGSNNIHTGNLYSGSGALNASIYAMQFGSSGKAASGNSIVGGYFLAFATLTPFNFVNDTGFNFITAAGYGASGGATSYGGMPSSNTSITYVQGGTTIGLSTAYSLQSPTGTTTGGNVRGVGAADLQLARTAATQVASGIDSFVAGANNTASGPYGSVAVGFSNVSSGYGSVSLGTFLSMFQSYSVGLGVNATDRYRGGALCHGSASTTSQGQAQWCETEFSSVVTGTSAARLTVGGYATGSSSDCANMTGAMAYGFTISLMAFDTTDPTRSWSASWGGGSIAPHVLSRGSAASSTVIDGVTTAINPDASRAVGTVTGIGATVAADTTYACINLQFTPPTGNTHTWHVTAKVETTEAQ